MANSARRAALRSLRTADARWMRSAFRGVTDFWADEEAKFKRPAAIPLQRDLNDFGKEGYHVRDTDTYLHTTQETEDQYSAKMPEKLSFSDGY